MNHEPAWILDSTAFTSQYIKVKSLLEALAVEMTVWQCISTARRGVMQGFPRGIEVALS